jgi:hypothetical protein
LLKKVKPARTTEARGFFIKEFSHPAAPARQRSDFCDVKGAGDPPACAAPARSLLIWR